MSDKFLFGFAGKHTKNNPLEQCAQLIVDRFSTDRFSILKSVIIALALIMGKVCILLWEMHIVQHCTPNREIQSIGDRELVERSEPTSGGECAHKCRYYCRTRANVSLWRIFHKAEFWPCLFPCCSLTSFRMLFLRPLTIPHQQQRAF